MANRSFSQCKKIRNVHSKNFLAYYWTIGLTLKLKLVEEIQTLGFLGSCYGFMHLIVWAGLNQISQSWETPYILVSDKHRKHWRQWVGTNAAAWAKTWSGFMWEPTETAPAPEIRLITLQRTAPSLKYVLLFIPIKRLMKEKGNQTTLVWTNIEPCN